MILTANGVCYEKVHTPLLSLLLLLTVTACADAYQPRTEQAPNLSEPPVPTAMPMLPTSPPMTMTRSGEAGQRSLVADEKGGTAHRVVIEFL
jgi:hypothetical protein